MIIGLENSSFNHLFSSHFNKYCRQLCSGSHWTRPTSDLVNYRTNCLSHHLIRVTRVWFCVVCIIFRVCLYLALVCFVKVLIVVRCPPCTQTCLTTCSLDEPQLKEDSKWFHQWAGVASIVGIPCTARELSWWHSPHTAPHCSPRNAQHITFITSWFTTHLSHHHTNQHSPHTAQRATHNTSQLTSPHGSTLCALHNT